MSKGFRKTLDERGFFEKFLKLEDFKVVSNPLPEEFQRDSAEFNLIVLIDFNA